MKWIEQTDRIVHVYSGQKDDMGLAYVIGVQEAPTYILIDDKGHHYSWCVHMCEQASPKEETTYWKARALRAEKNLNPQDDVLLA